MLSPQTPARPPYRPLVPAAANGATVTLGGAAGRAYTVRPVAPGVCASRCGTVQLHWQHGGLPSVTVGGRACAAYALRPGNAPAGRPRRAALPAGRGLSAAARLALALAGSAPVTVCPPAMARGAGMGLGGRLAYMAARAQYNAGA